MASRRATLLWLAVGGTGFLLAPWYAVPGSLASPRWIADWHAPENAAAWLQAWRYGRGWLWPVAALLAAVMPFLAPAGERFRAYALVSGGGLGFAYTLGQGFA